MNEDIKLMMKIYSTYELDWMGDEIGDASSLTRHHIVKQEHGGLDDISNYALLTQKSHQLLNFLEDNYVKEYEEINGMFLALNRSLTFPSKEYYERMNSILKKVRKSIKNKRRGR